VSLTEPEPATDRAADPAAESAADPAAEPVVEPASGGASAVAPSPHPGPATDPAPGRDEENPPDPGRQLSLFGAEAAEPSVADLAGLLAGPAEVVRMGGTARLSIVVDAAWRVHVLVAELARRGIAATWEPAGEQGHLVRTSYASTLAPLAVAWLRGGGQRPPAGFHLNGRRLRLWLAAAGSVEPGGLRLGLGSAAAGWEPLGAALAAVGLPGTFLDEAAGGPAYRITGRRRLAHLAELVGDPPPAAAPTHWPSTPPPPPPRPRATPGPTSTPGRAAASAPPVHPVDQGVCVTGSVMNDANPLINEMGGWAGERGAGGSGGRGENAEM
jgi:hypothetical protein